MNLIHNLLPYNFAGTPNDIAFTDAPPTPKPKTTYTFTLLPHYGYVPGQGFTLFCAGETLVFTFVAMPTHALELPMGRMDARTLLGYLLQHPTISLHFTGRVLHEYQFELQTTTLVSIEADDSRSTIRIVGVYAPMVYKAVIVHCVIGDSVIPSHLPLVQDKAAMGLTELLDIHPLAPNPKAVIQKQLPTLLQIRYGALQGGVVQRMMPTDAYAFIAGASDAQKLNPPPHPTVWCVPLHDYDAHPVYVHRFQPNWIYLFCVTAMGSDRPFDSGNAMVQFACHFSDGSKYQIVVDEEVNFSMAAGNTYILPCGLEQLFSNALLDAVTPPHTVIDKYCFQLVSVNRRITYFTQYFFVDARFTHPVEQTTFLCYDNGVGGFQTAFFAGTVQPTEQVVKEDIRNHLGEPSAVIGESSQLLDVATGYWDDWRQLQRYLRILHSPKVYWVDWQVQTVDKIALQPVHVKTTAIALPADIETSNAFTLQIERKVF